MDIDKVAAAPLAPATLHILVSLAGEPMHGYGIMQEVERQSKGAYRLGPGTLYDNIQRLVKQGLIEEVHAGLGHEDSRRRYYNLTASGRDVLAAEIARLDKQLARARKELEACRRKLDNANFVENAPADIIAKERDRAAELSQRSDHLSVQLARIREIA